MFSRDLQWRTCLPVTDQMWNTLACVMKDETKDSLGVASARTHSTHMESWWSCEEVQTKVATKQSRFKDLISCSEGNQEDIDRAKERYKAAKREAKIAVAKAKDKAYEDLYKKLDSKEAVNEIYKIAKARERRRRDIRNVKYIKDKGGRTIIFSSAKMSDEWRLSEVIPVYKNKGDAQACSNYRGIKLLSHTMKLRERVIERRSLMEKYMERQRDLHMAFLDLEKAYDSVPRELVWKTLLDKGTPRRYSRVIKHMCEGAKTYSTERLNNRLESWRKTLEDNGLQVSREKTKYLRCDFGRYEVVHQEMDIRIRDQFLQPNESFRYLGSVLHRSRRIVDDVAHRIRAGWMKWRAASGVLCDKRIPLKLKGKFYRAAIRPTMLYGSECWPITKALAFRVEVAELRMLRWTCGKTMVDMISNGVFRAALDVDSIIDKMREERGRPKLRWEDRLKMDMKELRLFEDMTSDRNAWRDRIRIRR
nr:hypothetical protein [Tanacetum cinerariifolium]